MPRGRVVEARGARPYRPPERGAGRSSGVGGSGSHGGGGPDDGPESIEDAIRRGYEEGLRRGKEDAEQQLAEQLIAQREDLARSLGELHTLAERVLEVVKDQVTGLALQIASRIVREKVDAGDPVAARAAAELLEKVGDGVRCKLRAHPTDKQALTESCPALAAPGLVELVPDPSVGRGGVVVETEDEELDARIGTAYQALWEAVAERR